MGSHPRLKQNALVFGGQSQGPFPVHQQLLVISESQAPGAGPIFPAVTAELMVQGEGWCPWLGRRTSEGK